MFPLDHRTYRRASGLHDEDLLSTHVLVDLDVDLVIVEASNLHVRPSAITYRSYCGVLKRDSQILADGLGEVTIATSREDPRCDSLYSSIQKLLFVVLSVLASIHVVSSGHLPLGVVLHINIQFVSLQDPCSEQKPSWSDKRKSNPGLRLPEAFPSTKQTS